MKILKWALGISAITIASIFILAKLGSNEVFNSFGKINEQLIISNNKSKIDYKKHLDSSAPLFNSTLKKIDSITSHLHNYLENIKTTLNASVPDPQDYANLGESDKTDAYFFDNKIPSKKGIEFIQAIHSYELAIKSTLKDHPTLINKVEGLFNLRNDAYKNAPNQDWLEYNFKGFPFIAVIARLSNFQADINNFRQEIFTALTRKN